MTRNVAREPRPADGFTLLELLVAMAIFAIVGALAMGGLSAVLGQQRLARTQLERLHQVQRAVRVMANDFSQLNPRYVRDILGSGTEPPLAGLAMPCPVDAIVCLSREGWRNPFWTQPRGTLQRVQYRSKDNKLIRDYWPVMDRTLSDEPRSEVLLDRVDSLAIDYFVTGGEFQPQWPPLAQSSVLPQAVRITIRLADWGEIIRWVEVAA